MSSRSALKDEIRQNLPFRSLSQEAVLGLLRTTDIVQRKFASVLGPKGMTQQQYNVLRILRGAGDEGLPTLAIAERMVERTPGITRLIDRLLSKKLVDRERASGDRRCVVCRISATGLDLLAELDEPMGHADDEILSMLTTQEQKRLIELLDRVREAHRDR